jgi:hypothetical protein
MSEELDPSSLHAILDYNPDTGKMYWRVRPESMFKSLRSARMWNTRYSGRETAPAPGGWGYKILSIFSVKHRVHRVAWAMYYGEWPEFEIDHINRNPDDNRISNLRAATSLQNSRNKGEYVNNKSGYRGVTWHKSSNKWMAQIKFNRKNIHLGLFSCPKKAGDAYIKAAKEYYGREYA